MNFEDLSKQFFQTFSRVEYSLKASGFHNGEGRAEPNWLKFADAVESIIEHPNSPSLSEAINYILTNPPKSQFIRDEQIRWEDSNPGQNTKSKELFIYLTRVRNNLFHGGKVNGQIFPADRREKLLRYSILILESCIHHLPEVREVFHA
ncbi:hypothetical protein Q5H92_10345 [Hymenobacter sp. M29]|uniref:Apea-like HEPN domain-containing protein n=1 Tax=Hymenobacter mellowenesis TaxID=3063995 RepID=A0ABT9ADJ3_9BACT|nr:hypothetical protein [Hymenobacter sp. M29]MDO7846757.1 hypothetical protein [Hymenobacter sp. M29]